MCTSIFVSGFWGQIPQTPPGCAPGTCWGDYRPRPFLPPQQIPAYVSDHDRANELTVSVNQTTQRSCRQDVWTFHNRTVQRLSAFRVGRHGLVSNDRGVTTVHSSTSTVAEATWKSSSRPVVAAGRFCSVRIWRSLVAILYIAPSTCLPVDNEAATM